MMPCNLLQHTNTGCPDNRQHGFTLVELMIAMVISLLLIGGTIQLFIGNKQTYRTTEASSRVQENARFAMHFLQGDVRMAGFIPCALTGNIANTVNGYAGNWWMDFFNSSLNGYEGGVSTFPADFPATGTSAGARVAGTDAIVILGGSSVGACISSHNAASAQFALCDATSGISKGDIMMVCDATHASIFQMTGPTSAPPHSNVVHNTGVAGVSPGNCTKGLGSPLDCSTVNGTAYEYDDEARLVKFQATAYFIGVGASGENALYKRTLENTAGAIAPTNQELVEGIENMQILYGEDTDTDNVANYYVTADQVTNMQEVVSVRITLTVVSDDNISKSDQTHSISGATDHRLRHTFTSTIGLRNRLL